jgi:ATP-binding cassette subfamily B protein
MRTSFVRIAQGTGELSENSVVLNKLADFMAMSPRMDEIGHEPRIAAGGLSVASVGTLAPRSMRLSADKVSFRYSPMGRSVLDDLSFTLNQGEVTGLVGVNGAGKTTLVRLLSRLYDPSEGSLELDGADLRDLGVPTVRRKMAVVGQSFSRFPLSVRLNVFLRETDVSEADEARIEAAAGLSFVRNLPKGWDSVLSRGTGEGTTDLSGGQWQRIAVARALARDAPICILDEPTASLDALAELELFRTYREFMRDRISLLVTHRFTSVADLDRILVLDSGRLIGDGTHAEVLRSCPKYADLYRAQRSALDRLRA